MQVEKLALQDIRYNPELGAFEAAVQIRENGESFSYPAHLMAPLHADFELVARGLTQKALSAHRHNDTGLRMRNTATPQVYATQTELRLIETTVSHFARTGLAA